MGNKIEIEHSNSNGKEFGYGIYINGIPEGTNEIWASECLPRDATDKQIKAAEKRVRRLARDRFNRELSSMS